ncbi:MAG: glutaminase, partial [Microbacterium sp.]
MATVFALLDDARARLAGAPRERLGDWAHARKLLGFGRAPRIVPVGEAWHVGVFLIGDAAVYATGEVLRARSEAPRGYTAEAQRARSE